MKKKEIKFINYRSYIISLSILLFLIVALTLMFNISPIFATTFSKNITNRLKFVLCGLFSVFPFAFSDILCIILGLLFILSIIRIIVTYIVSKRNNTLFLFKYRLKKSTLNIACFLLAAVLFALVTTWVSHYSLSFRVSNNISDDTEIVTTSATEPETSLDADQVAVLAVKYMNNLSKKYPCLGTFYYTPKASFLLGDAFFPFTCEVSFSEKKSPANLLPYRICRELAVSSGYPEEADLIAYLCCVNSGDEYFLYSAYLSQQ